MPPIVCSSTTRATHLSLQGLGGLLAFGLAESARTSWFQHRFLESSLGWVAEGRIEPWWAGATLEPLAISIWIWALAGLIAGRVEKSRWGFDSALPWMEVSGRALWIATLGTIVALSLGSMAPDQDLRVSAIDMAAIALYWLAFLSCARSVARALGGSRRFARRPWLWALAYCAIQIGYVAARPYLAWVDQLLRPDYTLVI